MENYTDLKVRQAKELSDFEGIFFAFNNEQFKEGMEKIGLTIENTKQITASGAVEPQEEEIPMTKKDLMYERIKKHGADLNNIFNTGIDDIKLSKKLFSLENKAHKLALDYCNGENNVNTDNWETLTDTLLTKVDKIIGYKTKNIPVFVNGDARGYALKIKSEYVTDKQIYKDWGGYGIIAPDLN